MEHIQKDDIIIRKGILHILDSHTGYLGLSSQLLEMGPDLMEFVIFLRSWKVMMQKDVSSMEVFRQY